MCGGIACKEYTCISPFFVTMMKYLQLGNFVKKRGLLARSSGGSRAWHWNQLSSGGRYHQMGVCVEVRGPLGGWEAIDARVRLRFLKKSFQ